MALATHGAITATRSELPNGLVLLHSPAPSNPSVVVRALVRAGASREALDRRGLAGITGRMLRQGTQAISKDALDEELDGMGAGLSVDVGFSFTSVSIKCLSEDVTRAFEILAEVLRHPTFPTDQLERVRGQMLTDLREMDDNTRVVAERAWREAAYPAEHRYSGLTSGPADVVAAVGRDELESFHHQWFGSNQTVLIVVGAVEQSAAEHAAQVTLGDWASVDATPVEATLPPTEWLGATQREVAMTGKSQADVVIGLPSINRRSPDYYALSFANHIMGRIYFMGRFGEKVRDEQGLAYYAYSELQGGYGSPPWSIRAGVNPQNLDRAIASIHTELDRFLKDGPTATEQADGVASLQGSLPRQIETNEGTAAVLGEIEMYDLGLDYLDRFPDIIRSLSPQQVVEAARRWLKPDQMVTTIAGPPR